MIRENNKKIIFICKRNRFRSQIAKVLCNKLLVDGWLVESYGFLVRSEDEKQPFSENPKVCETIKGLKEIGIDISGDHSKQLYPEHLQSIDKTLAI